MSEEIGQDGKNHLSEHANSTSIYKGTTMQTKEHEESKGISS